MLFYYQERGNLDSLIIVHKFEFRLHCLAMLNVIQTSTMSKAGPNHCHMHVYTLNYSA